MSKDLKEKPFKSNKSNKSKDQFNFDSRQTKFIGKRSGKSFVYMDPSKTKYGIVTQFNNHSDDQQNIQTNSISKEQSLLIFDQNQQEKAGNIKSIIISQKQKNKSQQFLQTNGQREKNKKSIIKVNQIEDKQKIKEQKDSKVRQQKQICKQIQVKQKNKQKSVQYKSKKQICQVKQKKNQKFEQFVLQFNEDQFKRERQQDYLNQTITNIQLSEEQQQKCEIKQKKKQSLNLKEKKKKKLPINIVKSDYKTSSFQLNNKKQFKKQIKKQVKHKSKLLTQILRKEPNNFIVCESIKVNNKKIFGIITFLPNTKTYFRGYTNQYSQLIIKYSKNYQSQVFLHYLQSISDFKTPNFVQSDIPFIIENASKNKNISLSFTLSKDQEQNSDQIY